MIRRIAKVMLAAVFIAGCGDDDAGDPTSPPPPGEAPSPSGSPIVGKVPQLEGRPHGKLSVYEACTSTSQCELELECVSLLGSSVCMVTGCTNGVDCPADSTCVESPAVHPEGVCAKTGGDTFCAQSCRDPLVCNIDPGCVAAGCCGEIVNGCPVSCTQIDPMLCEITPGCPVSCCGA